MLSDLHVEVLLNLASCFFLGQSVLVGNFDLFVENLDSLSLGFSSGGVLSAHLLNVCEHLGFLLLKDLFLLRPLLLARLNLVNDNLGASLAGRSSTVLSVELSFDDLQSFDLHHSVKSLLLLDPVRLEYPIFLDLLVSDGEDFRGGDHLVDVLDIVVLLIHLVLGLRKERILAKLVRLDLKRGIGSPVSILLHHALLAGHSYSHLLGLLLLSQLGLLFKLGLVLDDGPLSDAVELGLVDDRVVGLVLLA